MNGAQAGDPTKYTGANWTNTSTLAFLAAQNPNPHAFACLTVSGCSATTRQNGFIGNATFRANAAAAGLPANFFIANPDALAGANITNSIGSTRYNALQTELRRRFSGGLQFQANYVYGKQLLVEFWQAQRSAAHAAKGPGQPPPDERSGRHHTHVQDERGLRPAVR